VVQGAYSSVSPEMLRDLPEEVLDGLQQFIDYSNLRALGFLMQIGCELTLEEVETRIELTKSNPDSA
ncbi:MAG TPA: hypothetical protein VLE74_04130, partial [Candidatus Saccharimonadales bacterium]|nr:hypothetical protein [Candidatus Saccharimonadales bacterium]